MVLAWADTRNGVEQHDSVSHALAVIERLGYESGVYDTFIRTDSNIAAMEPKRTTGEPASGGPNLRMADAIFFLGHRDVPIDDQQKTDLLAFVRDDGKGFVAAHTALTAWTSWPAFGELLGGRYDGHPWNVAAGHGDQRRRRLPGDAALPGDLRDHRRVLPAEGVLARQARACCCASTCRRCRRMPTCTCKDGDLPLAWAKTYGKGRVFYSSLGHDASAWDNRDVGQMYLEAIKWALGLTDGDVDAAAASRRSDRCPYARSPRL